MAAKIFYGTLCHSTADDPMVILEDHILGVKNGKIQLVKDSSYLDEALSELGLQEKDVKYLKKGKFLMPGLIDTHIHASQYVYTGTAMELHLLDWLKNYTYPIEANFEDLKFAEDVYQKAVKRVLKNGTTTACYFATIHVDATLKLCDIVENAGQRAYIGKVNMDAYSPHYYVETTQESKEETEKFVTKILKKNNPLIKPVITPRFAPNCTLELSKYLGHLAKQYDLPIQSHISETTDEVEWVKELFPGSKHYADVYDQCNLLTDKTVMAHGVYLSDEELKLFKSTGTGISHCPNSNLSLRSGMMDARRVLDMGVKLGLGTDVSGGYHPSMLDAIRTAVQVSNVISLDMHTDYKSLSHREAFKLATLGGSEVLGLSDKTGNFEVGKEFDALLVDTTVVEGPVDIFKRDSTDDIIQKFLFLGDDRNIQEVYVAGKQVL
ncbi:guanine deaminase-like isoform X1 [Lingula anatina]|uniref:Guanine deaminase n=2 Tax=Lingula anatina TaxID=7574 RepID=A0A1S3ING8_LINAN|nr:guanine deaminase-like isoform X1 [Lingula anatina]|eukprot:XP_013399079.1 guanine deaminase-like isoform X1 [Lingula anatina]